MRRELCSLIAVVALFSVTVPVWARTSAYEEGAKHVAACEHATVAAAKNSNGQHRTASDIDTATSGYTECQAALAAFPDNAWVLADFGEYSLAIAGTAANIHDQGEHDLMLAVNLAGKRDDIWTQEKACRYFKVYDEGRPHDITCKPEKYAVLKATVDRQFDAFIARERADTQQIEDQTAEMQQTEMEVNGWRRDR